VKEEGVMAQNSRVQKYQKLREEIEHLGDNSSISSLKPEIVSGSNKVTGETNLEDKPLLTDPITRGTVNIPYDELIKTHTKMTQDESFLTEEQMALEDEKNKRWSIVGTIVTILVIVSLIIGFAILFWRLT
jgi:hypothetical protein